MSTLLDHGNAAEYFACGIARIDNLGSLLPIDMVRSQVGEWGALR